ncbi:MAG TPA: hypothetical protein VFG76_07700, partial [Candidatus Polarisedimenticolia bacterium]|nr:hypothetical protein [Candidatus Polarisedimenticolia bacterium]
MTRHLSRTWSRRAALAACCVAAVAGLAAWGAAHRTPRRAGKSGTRGDAAALVRLAAGFMDRARATGDAAWYARAEEACARALENSPQ